MILFFWIIIYEQNLWSITSAIFPLKAPELYIYNQILSPYFSSSGSSLTIPPLCKHLLSSLCHTPKHSHHLAPSAFQRSRASYFRSFSQHSQRRIWGLQAMAFWPGWQLPIGNQIISGERISGEMAGCASWRLHKDW